MIGPDHARALLEMAEGDAKALRAMLDETAFVDSVFGFHAQQAVEKAAKAWQAARGHKYAFVHDVRALFDVLIELGENVADFLDLDEFTVWAVRLRYEPLDRAHIAIDRVLTIERVDALLDHVRSIVDATSGEGCRG